MLALLATAFITSEIIWSTTTVCMEQLTHTAFACSKSTMEREQCVKSVKVNNRDTRPTSLTEECLKDGQKNYSTARETES